MLVSELIGRILEKHDALLEQRLHILDYLPKESFNREHATIRLDIGRQTGKTTLICNNATKDDVIICRKIVNIYEIESARGLRGIFPSSRRVFVPKYMTPVSNEGYTVWIDDGSLFGEEELLSIYRMYSNAKRFIILG